LPTSCGAEASFDPYVTQKPRRRRNAPRLTTKGETLMAATILPRTMSIDTDALRQLLLSKLLTLTKRNGSDLGDGISEDCVDLVAIDLFKEKIDACDKAKVRAEHMFAEGVTFGVEATLAALADPFGDPEDVLKDSVDELSRHLDEHLEEHQKFPR